MRTSKKERIENARKWYRTFMDGTSTKSAIVIIRNDSTTNPYVNRTQFMAVPSQIGMMTTPVIIAESATGGIIGCFMDLWDSIGYKPKDYKAYHENDFNEWCEDHFGFYITYKDGLVFMLEREGE